MAAAAAGNDTAVTLGAGGLVPAKSAAVVMESEDLRISPREIAVRYVFRNTSAKDVELTVAFPLPEIDGGAVANVPIHVPDTDPLHFVRFRVVADGQEVRPEVEVRAFFDDAEITSELRRLGLPLSVLDPSVTDAVKKLTSEERGRMQKRGWTDCGLTPDGKCWPYWKSRVQFFWRQKFPANRPVDVRHSYRPIAGGGYIAVEGEGNWERTEYCPSPNVMAAIRKETDQARAAQARQGVIRVEREIRYILTTANNWSGPIGTFRLTVEAESESDFAATCFPGLQQVSPGRFAVARENYRPDGDLAIVFLQRP